MKADETHKGLEIDSTPPSPQVTGENPGGETGLTESDKRQVPGISKGIKILAVTAISGAVALTHLRRSGPPTPRPPLVRKGSVHTGGPGIDGGKDDIAGAGSPDAHMNAGEIDASTASDIEAGMPTFNEDICDQLTFASDAKPEEMTKAGSGDPCSFETQPDGKIRVIGQTLIESDGRPRDCFITPEWSTDSAVKVRGEVSGNYSDQGKIYLENGKLCVTMLHNQSAEKADVVVVGEATLTVMTTDRVLIKTLDPELDKRTGKIMRYVMVAPVKGETVIYQAGRTAPIRLKAGEKPEAVKIPLNVETIQNMGCYVASPSGKSQNNGPAGSTVLTAGALLLALRRRTRAVN
jgi:hypothetical protein